MKSFLCFLAYSAWKDFLEPLTVLMLILTIFATAGWLIFCYPYISLPAVLLCCLVVYVLKVYGRWKKS